MAVGELLLSAFFQVLFDRLASSDLLNFVRELQGGVYSELKKWENILIMIQAVLCDAEEKQLTDRAVKIWLDDLRDLAYDAEDILDEFSTKALDRKLMVENQKLIPAACFSCSNPSIGQFNMGMDSRIESITARLEELCAKRIALGLQLIPGGTSTTAQQRPPSSSVPTELAVFGRAKDKAKILEMLLADDPCGANFRVIPIVGMAGVGKTTLAREVYNDKAMENFKFDMKVWVCVSDDFDVLNISRAILESITSNPCDLKALNEVQVQLKDALNGKKFLLVLDDVWNENYGLWEILKAPFMAGAPNSKIIVTTRHSNVASTMGPIHHYNLKLLSDEDCWSIFIKHVFEGRDVGAHQISELFGEKVVKKCRGLPLAARTLAGLLRSKSNDVWEDILNNGIWDLPQESGILPVLRLSYHYLPSHLKRCFSYCAIFPKDHEFMEEELIHLWIGEGIIQQSRNNKQLEDLGSEYFHDLVSRSIFQQLDYPSSRFIMHDLVHDLAQFVLGETGFRLEEAQKQFSRFERARHFSYISNYLDGKDKFKVLHEMKQLRTFLPLSVNTSLDYPDSYLTTTVVSDLLPKCAELRVLFLRGYKVTELPNSFGGLKHLRYLNLSGTLIRNLPESTCSLFNLQILILRNCSHLLKLPSKMRNLINLRHLDITGQNLIRAMPLGMKELKNLHRLSNFIVGKGIGSTLKDLKNLTFLRETLVISGLENVNDPQEAREAALCNKKDLKALFLEWSSPVDASRNEVAEENVLEMLQPDKNIEDLAVRYYGGARFPFWIGDSSFSKIESLRLLYCDQCTSLPTLALLRSLKHLTILGMKRLKSIGFEIYGEGCSNPFQSLQTLCFADLGDWKCWESTKENENVALFPCLRELSIMNCPKFSGKLPDLLPSLEKLFTSKCAELVVSFSSFPVLSSLHIYECKGLVYNTPIDSKLVKSITISNSSLYIGGCKGMVYNNYLTHSQSLQKSAIISNILEFGKLIQQGFQKAEQSLEIHDSQRINLTIVTYPEKESCEGNCVSPVSCSQVNFPPNMLRSLEIEYCLSSFSFPQVNFLPNMLSSLKIENSRPLKSLPEGIKHIAKLESLSIRGCGSLTFVVKGRLPSSLKRLEINECGKLQFLLDYEGDACTSASTSLLSRRQLPEELEVLTIGDCPKLETIADGFHCSARLKDISIFNCETLKSIPEGLHSLNFLHGIYIGDCPNLVSVAERGLPDTISRFSIRRCEKIKTLPINMHRLTSLEFLLIHRCPSITSFAEEGFPTNITNLGIGNLKICRAFLQWGLHRLNSLRSLWISGYHDAESLTEEELGVMLPTSLTNLDLGGLKNLQCLSTLCLQSLTSLQSLTIYHCPKLKSFPELDLPSSLKRLNISNCPKLKSFPESGLPSSVLELSVENCSLLEKRCKRDKGQEWSKIAHIPCVKIDGKYIYYP